MMKRPAVTRNEAAPIILHAANTVLLTVSRRLGMDIDTVLDIAIDELVIEQQVLRERLGGETKITQ